MKRFLSKITYALLFLLAPNAHAWTPSGEVATIVEIIEWQDSPAIVFKLSTGKFCYIQPEEKNAYALILAVYLASKPVSVYCHDAEENKVGFLAHRFHRISGLN